MGPWYTSLVIILDSACTASSSVEPSKELLLLSLSALTALGTLCAFFRMMPWFSESRHVDESEKQKDEGTHA